MPAKKEGESKTTDRISKRMPAKKEEKSRESSFAKLSASLRFRNFVVVLTTLLACCAVLAIIFFILHWQRIDRIFKAVKDIRSFIVMKNGTEHMTDQQIRSEVKKLADGYCKWNEEKNIVNGKVEEVRKLKKSGWKAFKGHLYFFTPEKVNIRDSVEDCIILEGYRTVVDNNEEEVFLEQNVKKIEADHWIGLNYFYRLRQYRWSVNPNKVVTNQYWNIRMPTPYNQKDFQQLEQNSCVAIVKNCEQLKCWENALCKQLKNTICMKDPEKEFLP